MASNLFGAGTEQRSRAARTQREANGRMDEIRAEIRQGKRNLDGTPKRD